MNTKPLLSIIISGLLFSSAAQASDCKLAKEQFDRGLAAGKQSNWHEAKQWLNKSVSNCNRFDNWYLLGQLEQELKNYDAAASAFEDARTYAEKKNDKALAIARYAEVLSQKGQVYEPLTLLHEVRKMHSSAPQWVESLARNLDIKRTKQPLTIAQVSGGLNNRAVRLLENDVKPSLNVSINFKYNSTEVIDDSLSNIEVLAEALSKEEYTNRKITIIGHADTRGEEGYNSSLSKKRADAIAMALASKVPTIGSGIATEGKGEADPLYFGNTEQDHMLNRRIEIQID